MEIVEVARSINVPKTDLEVMLEGAWIPIKPFNLINGIYNGYYWF